MPDTKKLDKKELRKYFNAKRKALSVHDRELFSAQVCDTLFALIMNMNVQETLYTQTTLDILDTSNSTCTQSTNRDTSQSAKPAKKVLLYASVHNELSLFPLFHLLQKNNIETFFPRCENKTGQMYLVKIQNLEELTESTFSILEPKKHLAPTAEIPHIACIPALAFDEYGTRLGMGLGYYDIFFAQPAYSKTLRVGVGYDFQISLNALPKEKQDISMQRIISPTQNILLS